MSNTPQPDFARMQTLANAFSPSAPIDTQSLFAGRIAQLTEVLTALSQKGQHVILFGERGVGKTSLARVISGIRIGTQRVPCAAVNCDSSMTFSTLWHKIVREIRFTSAPRTPPGFVSEPVSTVQTLADSLPEMVSPDDVRQLLSRLGKTVIVIDEVDTLGDRNVAAMLSHTIKSLSDYAVDSTLILVGVADSVDALIQEHRSVERALVQVRMPRMSIPELRQIIERGVKEAAMTIDDDARDKIASLSQGLPHYTHLLSLNAAQRAATLGRVNVDLFDVRTAIDRAVTNAQQSIISAHHKATSSPRENLYPQVLLACAMAPVDALGFFASTDVRSPLSAIMKRPYDIPAFAQHLKAFCDAERGPVLQRTGTQRRYRFRFENPLMQPFVIMDGIRKGLVVEPALSTSAPT